MRKCDLVQNADEAGSDSAAEAGFSGGNTLAAVSFSALYEALGKRLGNERTVLLLYDALHTCIYFQNYVLVRRWDVKSCSSRSAFVKAYFCSKIQGEVGDSAWLQWCKNYSLPV